MLTNKVHAIIAMAGLAAAATSALNNRKTLDSYQGSTLSKKQKLKRSSKKCMQKKSRKLNRK